MNKYLIAGLGNPGNKYHQTFHNAGFMLVEQLVDHYNLAWKNLAKIESEYASGDDIFLKSQIFMNNSGRSIGKALAYFKIQPEKLIVIHDDADLEKLNYKVQFGKQSAGHNGVQSIIDHLGSNKFWRIRVGIERPPERSFEIEKWVLKEFADEDLKALRNLTSQIIKELENIKSSPTL